MTKHAPGPWESGPIIGSKARRGYKARGGYYVNGADPGGQDLPDRVADCYGPHAKAHAEMIAAIIPAAAERDRLRAALDVALEHLGRSSMGDSDKVAAVLRAALAGTTPPEAAPIPTGEGGEPGGLGHAVVAQLWAHLLAHPNKRTATDYGTKTGKGVAACIDRIAAENGYAKAERKPEGR